METTEVNNYIGERIRNLRNRNGLTQQELADRTELTKGFISQLERGQVSASVVTLFDLIECLGSTPAEFFRQENEKVVFSENEYFEKIDEAGNSIQWIVPSAQKNQMEPLLVVLQPHSELEEDKPHTGEEFGFVISGRLNVHLGDKVYHVKAGESFYYAAARSHRLENPGNRPARLIWISSPPEF
ncbi:MAG: cupin domain-containing protein [Lachnospiraceae bacterium]|nr:cupin domain-containing protein [Sarcina sp.]MBQ6590423.1 cupin domain-containing protein [Lachnospiraceae bacterium]